MTMTLTPVLSRIWDQPQSWTLRRATSATTATRACARRSRWHRDDVTQMVKDSGLRGRGGAGFPTGMKWGFIPQGGGKPYYLVVNADESEPGTCKDIPLMMANPHELVEGVIIAVLRDPRDPRLHLRPRRGGARRCAGCRPRSPRRTRRATLGKDILGSGFDLEIVVHAGAGAYICGEETALLDSLEGRRGQPRLRPPFPAIAGLYASPDGHQQRRVDRQRPVDPAQRRRLVPRDGHRGRRSPDRQAAVRSRA